MNNFQYLKISKALYVCTLSSYSLSSTIKNAYSQQDLGVI